MTAMTARPSDRWMRRFLDEHPIALTYISGMVTVTFVLLVIDLLRR